MNTEDTPPIEFSPLPGPLPGPSPSLTGADVARVVFAVIGLTLTAVAILFVALAVLAVFGFRSGTAVPGPLLFGTEALVVWLALWLVLIRGRGFTWANLGWVPVSWGWLALGVGASAAIYAVAISLQLLLTQFGGAEAVQWLPGSLPLFPVSVAGFVLSVAFGGVAVPVAEEFLFRGVLYRWLRGRWGVSTGIVVSSLVFTLVHPPGAGGALQIFLVGLVLAWLFEKSGSLWPSMVLHGCNNAIGISWIYAVLLLELA